MLLLFMLRQLSSGNRLLAHITQGDVASTVDLVRGEVSFGDVMLAAEEHKENHEIDMKKSGL